MTTTDSSLARFYYGWETYQGYLTDAVAPLTPEQLALRAAPNLRSIGLLAAHIIAARVVWFHAVMGEGSADLMPMRKWDDYDPIQQNATELVAGLEATWSLIQQCLALWTSADLDQTFQRRDGPVSRQWIIWHVIEHDLFHGGELFLTCGIHSLPVPDL
jgi:uncharacterized damage-inducible protein DinB